MAAQAFFAALTAGAPDGAWLCFWTRRSGCRSLPADDAGALVSTARDFAPHDDVYCGVGLRGRDHGAAGRGASADVIAIPGVWCELDVADAAKLSGRCFATRAALDAFVAALPLPPTMVVASAGPAGGLHLYWLLKEAWCFEDDGERTAAGALLARWQAWLRQRAVAAGAGLDATHDLARVLRPPGTWNRKREPARPVTLERADGPRYNPGDLEDLVADVPLHTAAPVMARGAKALDLGAELAPARLELLLRWSPRFRATWLRQRGDLRDTSGSGYDLALAALGADAGLADAEIVALCVAHRRLHGDATKADRPDYWLRTIAKARARRDGVTVAGGGLRVRTTAAPLAVHVVAK